MAFAGPGIGLPYPQNPFPTTVVGVSAMVWSNEIYMAAGARFMLPPGWWAICATQVATVVQFLDPVRQMWVPVTSGVLKEFIVNSDGTNYRICNMNGLPVSTTITAQGTGYVQSTTSISVSAGGGTYAPIVGGAVSSTVTIGTDKNGNTGGTNFTLPPILVVQAPPAGGIACTMSCTVSAGAINAVTVRTAGAGYTSAPGILVVPNPEDPTLGLITIPALTATLDATQAGFLTGINITSSGAALGSTPSLTVNGGNADATATVTLFSTASTADTVFLQWLGGGG